MFTVRLYNLDKKCIGENHRNPCQERQNRNRQTPEIKKDMEVLDSKLKNSQKEDLEVLDKK